MFTPRFRVIDCLIIKRTPQKDLKTYRYYNFRYNYRCSEVDGSSFFATRNICITDSRVSRKQCCSFLDLKELNRNEKSDEGSSDATSW